MFDVIAEDLVGGRRVAGVLVSRDLVRRRSGDRHGGAEERLSGFLIAGLAQVDVNQIAVAVDRPVQVLPLARNFDVRLTLLAKSTIRPEDARNPIRHLGLERGFPPSIAVQTAASEFANSVNSSRAASAAQCGGDGRHWI